jgi:tetratricopeptide (TPR) repeat protein
MEWLGVANMKSVKVAFLGVFVFLAVSCARQIRPTAEATASFSAHLRQGSIYLNQGSYERALEEFDKAIALNPSSATAYNLSGLAHFRQKDYQAAESRFLKAVALDSSFASAYNNLGGVYAMRSQWSAAKEMLTKAISLSPEMASAHFSLGTVYFNLGDSEQGTACFAKGIALDPDYLEKNSAMLIGLSMGSASLAEVHFAFAKLYASTGDVERTVEFLKKAKEVGFHDWHRIARESEFEKIRDDPRIREFLKD